MFKRKQTGDEGRNIKPALEDGEKSGFQRNRYKGPAVCLLEKPKQNLWLNFLARNKKRMVRMFTYISLHKQRYLRYLRVPNSPGYRVTGSFMQDIWLPEHLCGALNYRIAYSTSVYLLIIFVCKNSWVILSDYFFKHLVRQTPFFHLSLELLKK